MNKSVVLGFALLSIAATGCSSSPEKQEGEIIEVGNVEYNSLYHFGYNTGCTSALAQKKSNETLESMKDKTLDGIDAFDNGWKSGTETCNSGTFKSMYTVGKAE
ncbi:MULTISPECIES: hypothetical protein [Shewanella]|uniref:Lipoprotein n=1 Tax=Shewanella japonica TaxID=93973 RepID=A0ABM6JPX7_9GAMM|nr:MULTISPECIES: hypothetical protein [Shewanella]ARD23602.1 hypothetical protein SJ2017_3347 [Shewanella japonica]KPZ69796.1 hypothetical protein AN944_02778 [Shewanella sp. P1-14-1]MBQ4889702.1 hypothetical protein [Shewanella sp. MMG014]OBT08438.1 hypothetical protein A9267_12170 [Shewanella sp. UCD-FRSSP16_17]